jgi:hypothetical protein
MTMPRFILEPSATATWQRAVQEAARVAVTELDEDRESYLVFLLMRYLRAADLLRAVLALEFLESFDKPRRHRCDALRRVGDQCLVIAGLFPEQAARRRVRLSYFVELGRSAYSGVAEAEAAVNAELYHGLAATFVDLADVLRALRSRERRPLMSLMEAVERHLDTGSALAASCVAEFTDASPLPGSRGVH